VAVTFDDAADTLCFYRDGQLVTELTATDSLQLSSSNFCIGMEGSKYGKQNFDGTIDEFRLYSRALSAEEVAQTMTPTAEDTSEETPVVENTAPVAIDDAATVDENGSVLIEVLSNDSDADGDSLTLIFVGEAVHGQASMVENTVRYTPTADFAGNDSFAYTISDGQGGTDVATVAVVIAPAPNAAPVAVDDVATVDEDASVLIDVLANDSDADGDSLTLTSAGPADYGQVTMVDAKVRYTPPADFAGTDAFAYTISDGQGNEVAAQVVVSVNSVNDVPSAVEQTLTTAFETAIDGRFFGSDPEGDALSFRIVSNGALGTAEILDDGASFRYTPQSGVSGADSFSYVASDGTADSAAATVAITIAEEVIEEPVDEPQGPAGLIAYWNFDAQNGTVAEDKSGNGHEAQLMGSTWTDGLYDGAISLDGQDDCLEVPTVTLNAKALTIAAWINRRSDASNDGIANQNDGKTRLDGFWLTAMKDKSEIQIKVGNTDYRSAGFDLPLNTWTHVAVTFDDAADTLCFYRDGQLVTELNATDSLQLSSANFCIGMEGSRYGRQNFDGSIDEFRLYSRALSAEEVVQTMTPTTEDTSEETSNDTPVVENVAPVAVNDAASVDEDGSVLINVLSNDSDADADSLTLTSVGSAAHGQTAIVDAQVRYTPTADFAGNDSFTYTVADGNGGEATATVSVTVTAVVPENNAPVAVNDAASVDEDGSVLIEVLSNDSDADADSLTLTSVGSAAHGQTAIVDAQVRYTPTADFAGNDSFTYTVADGQGGTAVATVAVTVNAVLVSPTIALQPVAVEVTEGQTASFLLEAAGTAPFAYQWRVDGVDIAGATKAAYTTAILTTEDDGQSYSCLVSNEAGEIESAVAILQVMAQEDNTARVSDGLQVLYTFNEGSGAVVNDVSGVGTALNLTIDDTSAVSWQDGALAVQSSTLIASDDAATKLSQAVKDSNEITIEAWVKSASVDQDGPARIVTMSHDAYERNATLGQEGDYYQVRMRCTESTDNGKPYLTTDAGVVTTELTHIVYTRTDGKASVFINGVETASDSSAGDLSSWDSSYSLALANELSGGRPWLGEYHLVAIYSRALSTQDVTQNYSAGTAGVSGPAIESFVASSTVIAPGESITLEWQTRDADTVELSSGTGAVSASGTLVLTPQQTTTYTLTAAGADLQVSRSLTVKINTAPLVADANYSVEAGNALLGLLDAGDADGDALTYSLVANGSLGTATITNAATGAFSYTPSFDADGIDTFTFKVNDGSADSATATVTVMVTPTTSVERRMTLAWNANAESDLAGYKLHYGFSSGVYQQSIDVGNQTQYTLGSLTEGATYYLALTAYNASGLESDYSNEVTYTVPTSQTSTSAVVSRAATSSEDATSADDTLDYGLAAAAVVADWTLPILVDGAQTVTLGMSETATDGWDERLDEEASADTGALSLVSLGTTDVPELSRDLRSPQAVRQDWYLQLKGGASQAAVISWDPAQLPQDAWLIWSTLDDNGAILPGSEIDLAQVGQIELPAGHEYYRLSFIASPETSETLNLVAGWNLVSFALQGADDSLDSVFGNTAGMVVWTFDADTQAYQAATQIQPGLGYWVFAPSALTIAHTGVPAIAATANLKAGWNLVGAVATVSLPVGTTGYTWDSATQQQIPVTSLLVPGKGYWLFTEEDQDTVLR
jgi:hypothetical protein